MTAEAPLFSVVVPTYRRPAGLAACLAGLAALDFPRRRFEVIVSDDGSGAPPAALVGAATERLQVTLVSQRNAGPGAARNRGAEAARGAYLAFLDDDCVPAPGWLAALANRFADAPDGLVAGRAVNALPENPFSTATQLIVTYAATYYAGLHRGIRLFNTTNLAVPTEQFRRLGGFSPLLRTAEDYDFCRRWQRAGLDATYAPEAVVYHAHPLTLHGFCRQHFEYGRGLLRYRLAGAGGGGPRSLTERLGFYAGLVRFPLTQGHGARASLHALLVTLSQVATAAGALREACTARRRVGR